MIIVVEYVEKRLREAVEDQIAEFRTKSFGDSETVQCAITGLPITKKMCHIDHEKPTFAELAYQWLKGGPWSSGYDGVNSVLDGMEDWRLYHKQNAVLRPVYSTANLHLKKTYPNWGEFFTDKTVILCPANWHADYLCGLNMLADSYKNRQDYDKTVSMNEVISNPAFLAKYPEVATTIKE